jgi:metallo-beta-lactamase family protein
MQSLELLRPVAFDQDFDVVPGVRCRVHRAGHLLGAGSVHLTVGDRSVLFSGDIGRPHDPIMLPPLPPIGADVMVVESTYGNRKHRETSADEELAPIINAVAARGGVVVIPTFAVGRAQSLLLFLGRLRAAGRIPSVLPVFLDSPMAIDATGLYLDHRSEHRLTEADCALIRETAKLVRTRDESRAVMERHGPMVILAASGMATGGRVLHHLKSFAPDARNAIVLSGYQAGGTRGAAIARGDRSVRIHGMEVPIRADVHQLESASAHADADEVLAWMQSAPRAPERVYVTHGEPDAADALRARIEHELGWRAEVPEFRDSVDV